jgi:tetratricopeptide (TPR) repeat protein
LDDAEKLARSAVQAVPENAALRVTLARVLLAENRTDEALAELREAQRIDPKSATAGAMLEQARLQAQGIDTAKSRAKALAYLRAHPDDAEAAYAAGYFSEALGFFASAARYYAQAAELDPQHHQAMLGWARSLASADEPAQAVAVYKQILERWPDDWQAHTNLAVLLMLPQRGELYQPKQAIQHAERALALAPDHVKQKVTLNLAEVCGHVGQTQRAIKLFEKVRDQLPPDDPQRQRLQSRIDYFKQQK